MERNSSSKRFCCSIRGDLSLRRNGTLGGWSLFLLHRLATSRSRRFLRERLRAKPFRFGSTGARSSGWSRWIRSTCRRVGLRDRSRAIARWCWSLGVGDIRIASMGVVAEARGGTRVSRCELDRSRVGPRALRWILHPARLSIWCPLSGRNGRSSRRRLSEIEQLII